MKWYREHFRLVTISAVVLILVTLTGVSYAWKGDTSPPGRLIQSAAAFITEPVAKNTNRVAAAIKGVFQFRRVAAENEQLRADNARLQSELTKQRLSQANLDELQRLANALHFQGAFGQYETVAGEVIAMDSSLWFRIFTVNLGTEQGISKDSVIINADGLVGRVMDVGKGWAKVVSVIDENTEISFRVYRDPKLIGLLKGDGKGNLTGYMLDINAEVVEGDVLVASGLELYPMGIPIGKITKVVRDNDALLERVEVEPAVNFKDIRIISAVLKQPAPGVAP